MPGSCCTRLLVLLFGVVLTTAQSNFWLYNVNTKQPLFPLEFGGTYNLRTLGLDQDGKDIKLSIVYELPENENKTNVESVHFRVNEWIERVYNVDPTHEKCNNRAPYAIAGSRWWGSRVLAWDDYPLGFMTLQATMYGRNRCRESSLIDREWIFFTFLDPDRIEPVRSCPDDDNGNDESGFHLCQDLLIYPEHAKYFETAASSWTSKIVNDLPPVSGSLIPSDGICSFAPTTVDDNYLCGWYSEIDGPDGILGAAAAYMLREEDGTLLPFSSVMFFDLSDVSWMAEVGVLEDIILHETAHAIGLGSIWEFVGLTQPEQYYCSYDGTLANAMWQELSGCIDESIPLELGGGPGTRCSHWSEYCFGGEIMTGMGGGSGTVFSSLTLAALEDLGYQVDYSTAEAFSINPNCTCHSERLLGEEKATSTTIPPQQPRRLSDETLQVAKAFGKEFLAQQVEPLDLPDNVVFGGNKFVSVVVYEDGQVHAVDVWADRD